MPRRAQRKCPRCLTVTPAGQRCPTCAQRNPSRGSPAERGYNSEHRQRFRADVLRAQPYCVLCLLEGRLTPSTDADHYPLSRRELVARGLDPNDPAHGRGLCSLCHKRETAKHQPGGWNRTET